MRSRAALLIKRYASATARPPLYRLTTDDLALFKKITETKHLPAGTLADKVNYSVAEIDRYAYTSDNYMIYFEAQGGSTLDGLGRDTITWSELTPVKIIYSEANTGFAASTSSP